MEITVFTPSYNRACLLDRLYKSLVHQEFKDFEWIIVDDGSTDHTEEEIKRFISEKKIAIKYIKVVNGGKHRCINKAVKLASGRLFFIVDSDDYLPCDALAKIIQYENGIPKNESPVFCGLCGLRAHNKGHIMGHTFKGKTLDITALERNKYKIYGDKAEVFYTDIIRKYPFPVFENEKFITECVVWNKMAADGYVMRYFNEVIYYGDYIDGGLTSQGDKLFTSSPNGWHLFIDQSVKYKCFKFSNKLHHMSLYYHTYTRRISLHDMSRFFGTNSFNFVISVFFADVLLWLRSRIKAKSNIFNLIRSIDNVFIV